MTDPVDTNKEMKPLAPTNKLDKKTSRVIELQRKLQYKLNFDVVDELIEIYRDPKTSISDRIRIALELMRYQYPQLKAMEIDQRDGEKICVNITFPDDTRKVVDVNETIAKYAS